MPTVFPVLGHQGNSDRAQYNQILRRYPDNSYRRYKRSNINLREIVLSFRGISKTDKEAIINFFNARMQASTSDFEFFVYNPQETSTLDPTGASATGRHLAIFGQDDCEFEMTGKCRFSGTILFFLLN